MVTIARKTKQKLKWIEENINKYKYKIDLMNSMRVKFSLSRMQCNRLYNVYVGFSPNTTTKTPYTPQGQIN